MIVIHVQCCDSDHCCLVISVQRLEWIEDVLIRRPSIFGNAWTRLDRYTQNVEFLASILFKFTMKILELLSRGELEKKRSRVFFF
jgi:hypothetical protein